MAVAAPLYVALSVRSSVRASRARGDTGLDAPGVLVGEPQLRLPLLEGLEDRAFSLRDRKLRALLGELLEPGASVCDVGCGDGSLLQALEQDGYDACGLDVDISMVAKARKRVERAEVLQKDLSGLSGHRPFDAVLFCDSIRYMLEPHRVLADALKIAKLVVISEPYELWHRIGRIVFLRFLYRVDHLSNISARNGPVIATRRTLFHRFWVLEGAAQPGSLDWLADEVSKETRWMINSLMHPALEARLKQMGAIALIAGIAALCSIALYVCIN
ncbi:MAG: class I SAM-dependent methyltransferase [Candidatus Binataceae bacterium]